MGKQYVRYKPEIVIPPGDILAEILDERRMSQADLARRMGRSEKTISQIINGKHPITPETANQLEMVLGTDAGYWLNHDARFQAQQTRNQPIEQPEESYLWLKALPLPDMKRHEIVSNIRNSGKNRDTLLREALQFFGCNSVTQWERVYGEMKLAYRISTPEKSDKFARAVWLRLGELQFEKMEVSQYGSDRFAVALNKIRGMTTQPPDEFDPAMKSLCADAGVSLVMVSSIRNARVSGAARWINQKPMIQLSLYGKANDRFWFSFFHEAGHILEGNRDEIYLDDNQRGESTKAEQEADFYASDMLIPSEYWPMLVGLTSANDIVECARSIDVHPAIVLGRLQHDEIVSYSDYNYMKESYILK